MNRHAPTKRRRIHHYDERRSNYHRKRRHCCGTGGARRAGEGLLEEGRQREEGRAQSQERRQGRQTEEASQGRQAGQPSPPPAKETSAPRAESKGAKILELIGRPKGASVAEIVKATDWQKHSIRGFLSTAAKKHGHKIESTKTEAGDRVYQIRK
jgi:hypothetical protein